MRFVVIVVCLLAFQNGCKQEIIVQSDGSQACAAAPPQHMTEQEAKRLALAYAQSKGLDASRVEKVTIIWNAMEATGSAPYWSVHLDWPFSGIPDADAATIWVEYDGTCKGAWER